MEVLDRLGRPLTSLRLSVTDRCNLRCQYCMPEQDYVWLPRADILTFEEIDTLVAWIDGGTPMGETCDLPPKQEYGDGWLIGKPDAVFRIPREYTVKAKGTVRYQYFVTPTNFKQDMWIQAAEARPGHRSVERK